MVRFKADCSFRATAVDPSIGARQGVRQVKLRSINDAVLLLNQATEACDAELPQHVAELARLMETMARHAARRRGVVGNRLGL